MPIIESRVDHNSEAFKTNRQEMLAMIEEIQTLEKQVHNVSNRKKDLFHKRGQLLPRERLSLLLDRGAPFIELSTLAGWKDQDDDGKENVFGAGIITGIGYIANTRCMIYINDAAIKGGTNMPAATAKLSRAQDIAIEAKLPFVSLIQSGGGNLLHQHRTFTITGGKRFLMMARSSAKGLPQVTAVHGSSTAGGAYVPGMSDYVVMVREKAMAFLAGPPLLKAATGEIATAEELGGAEMHSEVSGVSEFLAEDDAHAIEIVRDIVAKLNWEDKLPTSKRKPFKPPRYDIEDLCGVVPTDYKKPYDCREVIARLVDDSDFLEFKQLYDNYTICGFGEVEGQPCGFIGNNGPITPAGAAKAGQFIQLCCQSDKPIIYLQNTTGFIVGTEAEQAGIIKHGSKMIQAVSNATVPQITFIIGASYGAGNFAMCGRSFEPRFLFAWPNARLAVMGGEQAATVMNIVYENKMKAAGKHPDQSFMDKQHDEITGYYDEYSTALYCTGQVVDDGIIDPRQTRRLLAHLLDISVTGDKMSLPQNTFGVARF